MKLRAPSTPLITVDPFFSVWSPSDALNHSKTVHWTSSVQNLLGEVRIDGERYSFLGYNYHITKITQTEKDIDALSTYYTFENEKIKLHVRFTSPLLLDDLAILTRPVSYMSVSYEKKDASVREVTVKISVGKEICLNKAGEGKVIFEKTEIPGLSGFKIGNEVQNVLNRSGDNHRADWGYFYLCALGEAREIGELTATNTRDLFPSVVLDMKDGEERLFLFAYDDIASINYFGRHLKSYWNKDGKTITEALSEAAADYKSICERCDSFSDKLISDAYIAGGTKYADILALAYRQVIAAHKVAVDEDGEILFISKECFSNGCAATVDVSYPSIPMFLIYNTELLRGMLRPIYKFAKMKAWKYDFAPHDVGQYPLVTGQVYGLDKETGELKHHMQMPVEECGNMIIMEANIALADGNANFAKTHLPTLKRWCEYLIKYGDDPENQLCTDDFAGHMAHNCNLSLKAIMGIMGMSIIMKMTGHTKSAAMYRRIAKEKAQSWCERAKNADGSYRLAFDKEGTFSMKYNMVWDKIWGTKLFPASVIESEIASNIKTFNEYGMPLDSRCDETKSDWLVWCATLAKNDRDFKKFIEPLWDFYNESPSRIPMTDWYDTKSGYVIGFQNRTVQGGLFIKLLDSLKILKYKR